jgi:hypothetical protein
MRISRLIAVAMLASSVGLLGMAAPAAAAPAATTYHGVFTTLDDPGGTLGTSVDGVWQATWRGEQFVSATVTMFLDIGHHVSYGLPGSYADPDSMARTPTSWTVSYGTQARTVTLAWTNGAFTYTLPDYFGLGYTVTFYGTSDERGVRTD